MNPTQHEKHNLLSAAIFARCVGVFSLKTEHRHSGCFSLHTTQGFKELEGVVLDLKGLEEKHLRSGQK